jgi:hypothetical protein
MQVPREPGGAHLGRQLRAAGERGAVRALQHLPEVAVAGAVVQRVVVADRRPVRGLRGLQDLDRLVDLGHRGREGVDDGADLRRVDAPHARVAEAPAAQARRRPAAPAVCLNSVTTQCDGTLPSAWQAAAISSLARTTSGWSNCPCTPIADCGIAPRCAETKSISPNDSDSMRGCAAMACTSRSAPWVSTSACSGTAPPPASMAAAARCSSARPRGLGSIR